MAATRNSPAAALFSMTTPASLPLTAAREAAAAAFSGSEPFDEAASKTGTASAAPMRPSAWSAATRTDSSACFAAASAAGSDSMAASAITCTGAERPGSAAASAAGVEASTAAFCRRSSGEAYASVIALAAAAGSALASRPRAAARTCTGWAGTSRIFAIVAARAGSFAAASTSAAAAAGWLAAAARASMASGVAICPSAFAAMTPVCASLSIGAMSGTAEASRFSPSAAASPIFQAASPPFSSAARRLAVAAGSGFFTRARRAPSRISTSGPLSNAVSAGTASPRPMCSSWRTSHTRAGCATAASVAFAASVVASSARRASLPGAEAAAAMASTCIWAS